MNSESKEKKADSVLTVLAIFAWALPLAGLVWGPGQWWQYVLWLIVGTAVLVGYDKRYGEE